MTNKPQIREIFTFDQDYEYTFHLIGNISINGYIIEARDDGIILNTLEHIPTDKIVYFVPIIKNKKDETP